jgi:hypothetical protein
MTADATHLVTCTVSDCGYHREHSTAVKAWADAVAHIDRHGHETSVSLRPRSRRPLGLARIFGRGSRRPGS